MKHIQWILLGALLGIVIGKLAFPHRSPTTKESSALINPSLFSNPAKASTSLSIPSIHELTLDSMVAAYGNRSLLPGSREQVEFYLGMLKHVEKTSDMIEIAGFFNSVADPNGARELAKAVFLQLAQRDASAAFAAARKLSNQSLQHSMMRVVIEEWARTDLDAVITLIEKLPKPLVDEARLIGTAIEPMAKSNPQKAMALLDQLSSTQSWQYGVVLDSWIIQDQNESLSWLQSVDDTHLRQSLIEQALRRLTAHDPNKALEVALAIPHHNTNRRHPAQSMIQDLAALPLPGSLEKAIHGLDQLPDNLMTEEFMKHFAVMAVLGNLEGAIQFGGELPENDSLGQSYWEGLISQVAYKNPTKATELTENLSEGPRLSDAYEAIMRSWSKTDEFAAAQWLADLSPSGSKDKAILTFANELLPIDPERSVQWAKTIHEPNKRSKEVNQLVKQWRKIDPVAADRWQSQEDQSLVDELQPN